MEHPRWPTLVSEGLDSIDRVEFFQAEISARTLGIDPFSQLLARINDDPLDGPWYQAWKDVDTTRATLLTDRATQLLDLHAIASGPSPETGMGPEFKPHSALGWTLQGLRDHPGVGPHLIAIALQSPSIQNRNAALNALEAWPAVNWNSQHRTHLRTLAAADPNDKVRERAVELLKSSETPQ